MKKSAKKTTVKKTASKKSVKKITVKKPAARKVVAKSKTAAVKKSAAKKPAKKVAAKKHAAKKHAAKKHAVRTWQPAARDAVQAVKRAATKMYEEEVKTPFQVAMEMLHFYGRMGEQALHSQAETFKKTQAKFQKTRGR